MSQNQIIATVTELQELKRMQEELQAEIDSLTDAIKAHMAEAQVDTLTAGAWKVSYKAVTSNRLDSSAFKKAMPELAERFMKTTTTRRFIVQ